jgi:hypothetical protein
MLWSYFWLHWQHFQHIRPLFLSEIILENHNNGSPVLTCSVSRKGPIFGGSSPRSMWDSRKAWKSKHFCCKFFASFLWYIWNTWAGHVASVRIDFLYRKAIFNSGRVRWGLHPKKQVAPCDWEVRGHWPVRGDAGHGCYPGGGQEKNNWKKGAEEEEWHSGSYTSFIF